MINGILRKYKYYQILQRRALTSEKRLCGRWFINTFLHDMCKLHPLEKSAENKII